LDHLLGRRRPLVRDRPCVGQLEVDGHLGRAVPHSPGFGRARSPAGPRRWTPTDRGRGATAWAWD
jgi:hypothetical protein